MAPGGSEARRRDGGQTRQARRCGGEGRGAAAGPLPRVVARRLDAPPTPAATRRAALLPWLLAALALCGGGCLPSGGSPRWQDTFYQYRVPVTLQVEYAGVYRVALSPAEITAAINVGEALPFDPTWFAYNHLKVMEYDVHGRVLDPAVDAGFALVADDHELLPAEARSLALPRAVVPVEPGETYLLRYTSQGGGASPALAFEPLFPVLHPRQPNAYLMSHEPRLLPLAETRREVLLVPNTTTLPLCLKDDSVTGLTEVSLTRAGIVFTARFATPGTKRLMLYYQPLTGRFLTIPQRRCRLEEVPHSEARVVRVGPAEKYEGSTRYRLPGSNALTLWFAETTVKLTPGMSPPTAARDAIRITSAANEAQSFQLVLNARNSLTLNDFHVTDLVSRGGRIAADAAAVRRIAYVPISEPSFLTPVRYRGPLGDPLVALQPERLLPTDGNAGFWVTVRTPADTAPGTYRGLVIVRLEEGGVRVPLELEVYGFTLPEYSPFRSSMGGAEITKACGAGHKTVADYHAVRTKADIKRLARGYYDEMARNKFTPRNVAQYSEIGMRWTPPPAGFNVEQPGNDITLHDWDFTEFNRDLEHYVGDMKVNAFTLVRTDPSAVPIFAHLPGAELEAYNRLPQFSSLAWQTFREITLVGYDKREKDSYTAVTKGQFDHLTLDFYRAIAGNLEQHGWLDYACILSDQNAERGYQPYLDFVRLLKSDPLTARIRHVWCLQDPAPFTYKPDPAATDYAFNNLLDIYLPETSENHHCWEKHTFTDNAVDPARERLWNCATCSSRVAIDAPGINNRSIALEVFNNGGSGFLLWDTFIWDAQEPQESNHDNPWEQPWTRWGNGAMAYFYPPCRTGPASAPDFTIIPSLRVETYRESVDDFEYAWLLEKAIADARGRGLDVAAQEAVLKDIQRFFPETAQWSQNDAWYLALRDRLARAIVQLQEKRAAE
jgi:hypothetical protein